MKYSAINDLSSLLTDAEEQTAASQPDLMPPSGTDAAAAVVDVVSAAAGALQSTVEETAGAATGRAIAYLVLAGVPLALAVKTFRAFLPVLTLLFRASLALGGVVALTAIYDAYMALPPIGQTVAQVAVPLTAVVAAGAVTYSQVTRAVDETTSAVKKSVDDSPLGAAKLKVSNALESVRKAATGAGES